MIECSCEAWGIFRCPAGEGITLLLARWKHSVATLRVTFNPTVCTRRRPVARKQGDGARYQICPGLNLLDVNNHFQFGHVGEP